VSTADHGDLKKQKPPIDVLFVGRSANDVCMLCAALDDKNIAGLVVSNPDTVAAALVNGRPEVIVIDLRNGDALGERTLRWVCRDPSFAVLAISNPFEVNARLEALELGVADHLIAPFDVREGVARVQLLLTRQRAKHQGRVEAGDLVIDVAQRTVTRAGQAVPLTAREVDVLTELARHPEQPMSKRQLLNAVWHGGGRTENVVEANVSSLRRKLHSLGPPVIHTVHRLGYVFRPVHKSASLSRTTLVAERDRLVRERDEMIAHRDALIERLRTEKQS
jgi:two-component system OmpR family response regulator